SAGYGPRVGGNVRAVLDDDLAGGVRRLARHVRALDRDPGRTGDRPVDVQLAVFPARHTGTVEADGETTGAGVARTRRRRRPVVELFRGLGGELDQEGSVGEHHARLDAAPTEREAVEEV